MLIFAAKPFVHFAQLARTCGPVDLWIWFAIPVFPTPDFPGSRPIFSRPGNFVSRSGNRDPILCYNMNKYFAKIRQKMCLIAVKLSRTHYLFMTDQKVPLITIWCWHFIICIFEAPLQSSFEFSVLVNKISRFSRLSRPGNKNTRPFPGHPFPSPGLQSINTEQDHLYGLLSPFSPTPKFPGGLGFPGREILFPGVETGITIVNYIWSKNITK